MSQTITQKQWVLSKLLAGETLTPMDAFVQRGITRLGAVVFDLRKAGFPVRDLNDGAQGMFKRRARFSEYALVRNLVHDESV